ncbi:sensor histidine kinase [Sinanaerobacter chloroacetimidivorans]|uniref:GHKL domain-containing protein n=1 Tax=Sinanaerobacter chloroacetimidivorans TaxID=2818044 RepID=A0A8J8B1V4_9FIRM|nr:GHKL domain-containing protein [Sinanaerobacter chloroacetimidivorans]MBR0596635.1 GHKL domain-containing protein [Sinanaerobacter chloroacetimidivorans]
MNLYETFAGSFIEALSICFVLNLFNSKYLENKSKVLIIALTVASITTLTDAFYVPVGYLINYMTFVVLLSFMTRIRIISVFFEYIFTLAIYATTQLLFIFISNFIKDIDTLSIAERFIHLILILIICLFLGRSRVLQLRIRPFYSTYNEEIYLIAGNLFVLSIFTLYIWDTNSKAFYGDIGILIMFALLWVIMNVYLMKKLTDERKQKEMIIIHEQYMEMTENLINGLYAEKHEFRKHIQTIEGLIHTNKSEDAIKSIEDYINELTINKREQGYKNISYQTGDSVVNGLLYVKANDAAQNHISFYYLPAKTFPDFPCQKYELIEIIGNLIDNAFDYVKNLELNDRKVFITLDIENDQKIIEVRNTYFPQTSENYGLMSKKGYSTKDGDRRGYGLYNVKSTASKYNGKLNIFCEENQLVVQVLF